MKKRKCKRFTIPGTTLFYKTKGFFFYKKYSQNYFPVIDMSKGGACFLTDQRIKPGTKIIVKMDIPNFNSPLEICSRTRWIAKNREESYRYMTGISFNSYGENRNQNDMEILNRLNELEMNIV